MNFKIKEIVWKKKNIFCIYHKDGNKWITGCDHKIVFPEDSLKDNKINICPFCWKEIIEI